MIRELKTPCYCILFNILQENIENFNTYLPNNKSIIAYSVKTNPLPWIINYLNKNTTLYFEIVSYDEFELLVDLNVPQFKIIMNGPAWSKDDFFKLIDNVGIANLDSLEQVLWFIESQSATQIGLRINLDYMNDNKYPSHFGMDAEDVDKAISLLKVKNINIDGLHFHYVNQKRTSESYAYAAEIVLHLQNKYNFNLKYLDFGGGFWSKSKCSFYEYFKIITDKLKNNLKLQNIQCIFEPGAGIIADAVIFVSRILLIKNINNVQYAITDGGRIYTDPTFSNKTYIYDIYDEKEQKVIQEKPISVVVCGSSCMEQDIIMKVSRNVLPGMKIVYKNMGAYVMSLSPNFIHTFPNIYVATQNKIELIRARHKYTEIL